MINVFNDNSNDFNTILQKMLQEVILFFIEIGRDEDFDSIYSFVFPDTLEINKEEADKQLSRLENYIRDEFNHNLSPFDEYVVYKIISFVEEVIYEDGEEDDSFFIKLGAQIQKSDLQSEEKIILENVNQPIDLVGLLFEDLDFLDLHRYWEIYKTQPEIVTDFFHINLDDYKELLPGDIFEEYLSLKRARNIAPEPEITVNISNEKNFYLMIETFFDRLKFNIAHKNGHRVINNKNGALDENGVQAFIEIAAKMFFHSHQIDISSEVATGRGLVDFKFSYGSEYKVLVEVKLSTHNKIASGYKLQLPVYLHADESSNGIFVLICFSKEDYERQEEYLNDYDTDLYTIKMLKIDASGTLKTGSKLNNQDDLGLSH